MMANIGAWLVSKITPVLVIIATLAFAYVTGYVNGVASEKADRAEANADAAKIQAQISADALKTVVTHRNELENITRDLRAQESKLRNAINAQVQANAEIQKWMAAPVNPVLDLSVYGLPSEPAAMPNPATSGHKPYSKNSRTGKGAGNDKRKGD